MYDFFFSLSLFINHFASPFMFAFIIAGATLIAGRFSRRYALALFISVGLTFALTEVLKNIFAIPRPTDMLAHTTGYRFPSLHASLTSSIVTALWLFYTESTQNRRYQIIASVFAILIIFVVDYSRVFLNVHKPIDVIIGSLLGVGISFYTISILRKISR